MRPNVYLLEFAVSVIEKGSEEDFEWRHILPNNRATMQFPNVSSREFEAKKRYSRPLSCSFRPLLFISLSASNLPSLGSLLKRDEGSTQRSTKANKPEVQLRYFSPLFTLLLFSHLSTSPTTPHLYTAKIGSNKFKWRATSLRSILQLSVH